jgi:membrane-associated phospholipid phosphatase
MKALLDWGIGVVLWLQQFSPTLDGVFRGFTFLGEEDFFMLLMPLLYWCVDRANGVRLAVLFLLSNWVNSAVKVLGNQPRPFEYDVRVQKLADVQEGRGFPSGHTQSTLVVWGFLAQTFRKRWLWIVMGILLVFVPLSRVYLGLHFPTDLVGGYLLGGLLLWGYVQFGPALERWLSRLSLVFQIALVLVISVLLLLVVPGMDSAGVSAAGLLLGAGLGLIIERRKVRFESAGSWTHRALRLVLGMAGLLVIRYGLKAAFGDLQPEMIFRFIRYAAMGIWFAYLAPWLFVRLHLAGTGPTHHAKHHHDKK